MDVQLLGTGGPDGWPRPGCRCASCAAARAAGRSRSPVHAVVDGALHFRSGQPPCYRPPGAAPPGSGQPDGRAAGHIVRPLPGGWDVTGPDGGRLLIAAEPGAVPEPPPATRPYDVALLDVMASPWQIGALRQRGLVRAGTVVAACYLDDAIAPEREIARRCGLWGVTLPDDGDFLREPGPRAGAARPGRWCSAVRGRASRPRPSCGWPAEPDVTYLATAALPGGRSDPDWAQRIAAHRARRPRGWKTAEGADAAEVLRYSSGAVLLDGIGTWLAGIMDDCGAWGPASGEAGGSAGAAAAIDAAVDGLIGAWRQAPGAHRRGQ